MNTYHQHIVNKVRPALQKELGLSNVFQVPQLREVIVNIGIGSYMKTNAKDLPLVIENIKLITGQLPVTTLSKKAISNFKIRAGMINGLKVTLRGNRMYDFVNKLINVVLPRVRDFRGLSPRAFDGHGNYSLGLKEHTVFPEARIADEIRSFGIQVTIVTTAKTNQEAEKFLRALGFPFRAISS